MVGVRGWEGGSPGKGWSIHIELIHFAVQQKLR